MTRVGNYRKPAPVAIETIELCAYGCGQQAKFKFFNDKLCCSTHYNSCQGKRNSFAALDHTARTAKSLETRTRLGITKTSQAKGGATRVAAGHYNKLAGIMQRHWEAHPWNNNTHCQIVPYKDTSLTYQGSYEYNFLQQLEEEHGLEWIVNNVKRGPSLWLTFQDSPKLYISDFIIGNTIYEIKSSWTWNKNGKDMLLEELNKSKLTQCINNGYNVILVLEGKEIVYGN